MRYTITDAYTFVNTSAMTPSISHPNAPPTTEGLGYEPNLFDLLED